MAVFKRSAVNCSQWWFVKGRSSCAKLTPSVPVAHTLIFSVGSSLHFGTLACRVLREYLEIRFSQHRQSARGGELSGQDPPWTEGSLLLDTDVHSCPGGELLHLAEGVLKLALRAPYIITLFTLSAQDRNALRPPLKGADTGLV